MPSRVTINTNNLNVPWTLGTQFRIALDAGFVAEPANNKTGNPAVNNLVTFTTNATAPTLTSSSPSNDAFDVVNNTSVLLTFNRNVEAGAFNFSPFVPSGYVRLYEVGQNVDTLIKTFNLGDGADATISNNTISLNTTGLLAADNAYFLEFDSTAIRDIDNFNYAGTRTVKTVTAVGNTAANSAVVKWNGVPSIIFDGSGDYLTVPSSADFGYGTGAFIIEAWIRPITASQTSVIVDHRPTATEGIYPTLRLQSGVLQYFVDSAVRITGTTITVNDWSFVQVARFSGVTRLYVNGVQVGASYTDSNTYPTAALTIGASGVNFSAGFAGYMSDIKISKAPIGLGGLRTRSSVNDEYTVLLIQGGVNDNAYTIFFDTQEEALGFPSLSASITGAFTPTITVRYTAKGQIVLASSVGISATARKTARPTANLTSQTAITANVQKIHGTNATLPVTITINVLPNFTASGQGVLPAQFTISKMIWGHPFAAITTIENLTFDPDVSSGTYNNNIYSYARFADSRANKFRASNINWSVEPTAVINFGNHVFTTNGDSNLFKVNNNTVTFPTNLTLTQGPYQGRFDPNDVPYEAPGAYNGTYVMIGTLNNTTFEDNRLANDQANNTASGFYNAFNQRFFGHIIDMQGNVINTLMGPDLATGYIQPPNYVLPNTIGPQISRGDVDFCIDASLPSGGLAVVAARCQINVYNNITTNPVLLATLNASNGTHQNAVFINKNFIVLESTLIGGGNIIGYAIDFFDIHNSFSRTTYMGGRKIYSVGNGWRSEPIEQFGISEDSKTYIPAGKDITQTSVNPTSHRIKYVDQR